MAFWALPFARSRLGTAAAAGRPEPVRTSPRLGVDDTRLVEAQDAVARKSCHVEGYAHHEVSRLLGEREFQAEHQGCWNDGEDVATAIQKERPLVVRVSES
eukprot:3497098-Pleurochrysis_carterae.AAC.1